MTGRCALDVLLVQQTATGLPGRRVEYELLLHVTEDGRPLQDQDGQAVQQVVPLRQPEIDKKGEARFVGQAEGNVPTGLVKDVKHLRVQATLFIVRDSRPLATKQTGLKVHKPSCDW